jgi:hypothetical protein
VLSCAKNIPTPSAGYDTSEIKPLTSSLRLLAYLRISKPSNSGITLDATSEMSQTSEA